MNPAQITLGVAGLLFVGMLLFLQIGYRLGRRRKTAVPEASTDGFGAVDAAVFGLLGLIMAFTYSGAASRFDLRRGLIVQEANAIGTAYLRVDLLAPAEQPAIRALFRRYLDLRIEVYEKLPDLNAAMSVLDEAGKVQQEIWSRSVKACLADPKSSVCVLVVPSLNEMFDIANARTRTAFMHVPVTIVVLLFALSLFGSLLAGFAMSPLKRRDTLHVLMFALAISASVYTVLDLEYPRYGLINLKVTDQAIIDLRGTIK